MDIQLYLDILWRRKWIIITPVIIAVLLAGFATSQMTPTYTAAATIRIPASRDTSIDYGEIVYFERLLNTIAETIQSDTELGALREQIGFTDEVAISVAFPANTELMEVIAESPNRELTPIVANALAQVAIDEVRLDRNVRRDANLIESASLPSSPSSPNLIINVGLAMVASGVAGLGIAFLVENLDRTLYTTRQIRDTTRLSLIGTVPLARKKRRYVWQHGTTAYSEAFRRVRTSLLSMNGTRPLRTVLFTSAQPAEGKSTTVANLAYTLGRARYDVIVIDADLRLPTMHKIFEVSNTHGLSNVLEGNVAAMDAVQPTAFPGVRVLPSGQLDCDPDTLLHSHLLQSVLETVSHQAQIVLIDAPAFVPVSDTAILARHVDAVVLVVSRAYAQREAVGATCEQLASLNAHVIGMVINRAEAQESQAYMGYYRVS